VKLFGGELSEIHQVITGNSVRHLLDRKHCLGVTGRTLDEHVDKQIFEILEGAELREKIFIRFSPFLSGPNKAYIRTGIVLNRKMCEYSRLKQESPSKAREITSKA
jgi:hypothetical protein